MQRRMTFQQYRTMDLCFFTILLCVGEALISFASTRWFPGEPYTLSLTPAITAIVMVRWGMGGGIPALAGALVLCLTSGASGQQYAIYVLGNVTALALVPVLKRIGWKKLTGDVLLTLCYGLLAALLMQLGRFVAACLLGNAPGVSAGFVTTDILSTLFSVLICWIARRQDGMLEEQKDYLIRIQRENEQDKGE